MRRRPGQPPRYDAARADDFIYSYVCWREACDDVRAAYARWSEMLAERLDFAFESYLAALEREEKAASVHSACVRALRT